MEEGGDDVQGDGDPFYKIKSNQRMSDLPEVIDFVNMLQEREKGMVYNRDSALRAKDIAERKFESGDYNGAREFAHKAQSLYPGHQNIQHMVAAFDVYIAAEDRVAGDINWYKVLGVDPDADVQMVIKQYEKLALLLHPDKNKLKGADGAFKLISKARNVLCNSKKRYIFDEKRTTSIANNPVKASGGSCSNRNSAKKPRAYKKKSSTTSMPSQQQRYPTSQTFWTLCRGCMLQHEYLRIYLHKNVRCPNCRSPFWAIAYPSPTLFQQNFNAQHMVYPDLFLRYQAHARYNPWCGGSPQFNQTSSNWKPFVRTANRAPTAAQEVFERSRREREAMLYAIQREQHEGEAKLKRRRVDEGPTGEKSQGP